MHLRWDGGRVRSQSLARGHHSNWSGLPAGAAPAAAPGPNGAVVPARPRLSTVPRSTASRRFVSVSACLIGVRDLRAELWLLADGSWLPILGVNAGSPNVRSEQLTHLSNWASAAKWITSGWRVIQDHRPNETPRIASVRPRWLWRLRWNYAMLRVEYERTNRQAERGHC